MPPPIKDATVILLFLKAPVPGQVKTRLAAAIGVQAATEVYETLVQSQLQRLPREYALEIHFAPADAGSQFASWLGETLNYYPQEDGDLGDRLKHAVKTAFARGAREVICIGADCPSLLPIHFEQTVAQLRSSENAVVLGPTTDGGYYLIGLRQPHDTLFENVRWSTAHTLNDTLLQAKKTKLDVTTLETMPDIDEIEDLRSAIRAGYLSPASLETYAPEQSMITA
ncbi:MAG: TIGR04282 family arsenosugar biosynthesis glycosyltransferase [Opitutales bacterium]